MSFIVQAIFGLGGGQRKAADDAKKEAAKKSAQDAADLALLEINKQRDASNKQGAGDRAQARRASATDPFKKQSYGGTILTSPLGLLGSGTTAQKTLLGA